MLAATGERVLQAAGLDPASWKATGGGFGPVARWLAEGADVERDILPAIRAWARASPKRGQVRALAYFDGVVADHRRARLGEGRPGDRAARHGGGADDDPAEPAYSAEQNRRFSRYAAVLDRQGRRATAFRSVTGTWLGDADDAQVARFLGLDAEQFTVLLQGEKPCP